MELAYSSSNTSCIYNLISEFNEYKLYEHGVYKLFVYELSEIDENNNSAFFPIFEIACNRETPHYVDNIVIPSNFYKILMPYFVYYFNKNKYMEAGENWRTCADYLYACNTSTNVEVCLNSVKITPTNVAPMGAMKPIMEKISKNEMFKKQVILNFMTDVKTQ